MAYSDPPNLLEQTIYTQVANVSSTALVHVPAPFRGSLTKVSVMLSSAASTADATCTTNINGTAVTNGVVTVTQSGSAAGSVFTTTPTAANKVNKGDAVSAVFSGSGTAGGPVTIAHEFRRN